MNGLNDGMYGPSSISSGSGCRLLGCVASINALCGTIGSGICQAAVAGGSVSIPSPAGGGWDSSGDVSVSLQKGMRFPWPGGGICPCSDGPTAGLCGSACPGLCSCGGLCGAGPVRGSGSDLPLGIAHGAVLFMSGLSSPLQQKVSSSDAAPWEGLKALGDVLGYSQDTLGTQE